MKIVREIYRASRSFPADEQFGLTSQMKRCSVSIPSNIAEGFNRYHNKEYKQFLYRALGSSAELETQVEIAFELHYMEEGLFRELTELLDYESRMLRNLIKKL